MTLLEEFENTIKITKFSLLLSGVNLYDEKCDMFKVSMFQTLLFYLNVVSLESAVMAEIYFLYNVVDKGGSFIEHALMLPCMTISILGTIKVYFLFKYNCEILQIVNKLREIHPISYENSAIMNIEDAGENKDLENKIIKEAMTLLNRNIILLLSLGGGVVIMFCLIPLTLIIYEYVQEGIMKVRYPYLVKYFFDVYNSPFWYLEYVHQVHATGVVFVNILGADAMFYTICTYIEMHFKLLSFKIENMEASSNVETNNNFISSVQRHQELIDLVDKSEMIYTNSMLFNIVTSSLLICLSAFNMTVAEEFDIYVTYFLFLLMSLSQIFLICYFADNLMQASTGVSEAIYQCNWYNFDASTKKGLILILLRSQNPCKLTAANFADLNLNAFTTILSRSWSLFALLKTVYN